MVGPKLCFLVSLCLLVTPAALQEQEERGRGAKCKRPRVRLILPSHVGRNTINFVVPGKTGGRLQ